MTKFDPEFALEVMKRRQADCNKAASDVYTSKWLFQTHNSISPWSRLLDKYDKRIHELWDQADSYDSVIDYLEDRVWGEKTEAEKVWETIKDWDATYGPLLVEDVLHGLDIVRGEKF